MFSKVHNQLLILFIVSVCSVVSLAQTAGGFKGRVRTASGNGIANASISARQDGADVKTVTADSKGEFVLNGLAPGKYNVAFDAKGYAMGVLYNVEVKGKNLRDLGARLILSVDRGSLVIIQGSVFYKEGTSVTAAKVECSEVLADGTTKKIGSTFTSSDGEFTFKMRPGASKFRLKASLKGAEGAKDVVIDEGAAIYRLSIILDLSRTDK
ncbi:MAG: carboxypeptidase-like regulatory domain-containing protein [Acidobacteriota bacterium]